MNASQAPLNGFRKMKSARPAAMNRRPKPRTSAAIRVAEAKSPLTFQRIACRTRPPSSGSAGSRLKTRRVRLM
jgi:hypothetical protein